MLLNCSQTFGVRTSTSGDVKNRETVCGGNSTDFERIKKMKMKTPLKTKSPKNREKIAYK